MGEPKRHDRGAVAVPSAHAADLGPLAHVAAVELTALPAAVAKKLSDWQPVLTQRQLSARQWQSLEPLVRSAAVVARPSSADVAANLLGVALSLAQFATARRMPLRPERVYGAMTVQGWLATVEGSTARTFASHARSLTDGVTRALSAPTAPIDRAPADPSVNDHSAQDAAEGDGSSLEPLLMPHTAPSPAAVTGAGLDSPAGREVLAALAVVRAQVLAVEPGALRAQDRFRGRGRAVPYGDVEVAGLLAAASTQRSTKRRLHVSAAVCLGVGAGVTGERAAAVKGPDVTDRDGVLTVATPAGTAIVHAAFAAPVRAAAQAAGASYVLGGGHLRHKRISELADGLGNTDPHLVRLNSARLGATFLALHAVRGVPLRDLLTAAGLASTTALDQVLPFLPTSTGHGRSLLAGLGPAGALAGTTDPAEVAS